MATAERPVAALVYGIASLFVDEFLAELADPSAITGPQRDALVERASAAISQAVEQEYEAIRQELERLT